VAVSKQQLRRSGDVRPYDGRSVVRTAVGPFALVAAPFILLLESPTVSAQADTAVVWILVVKEHGVGSPTLVQP